MGAYASNFRNDTAGLVGEITHPSKEDWITAHATATGCKVPFVASYVETTVL